MSAAIDIVQLTDIHLSSTAEGTLCGLNTRDSFSAVLAQARASQWPPDLILATGDISQDQTAESYERFRDAFRTAGAPVYCLPGNHDDAPLMRMIYGEGPVQYKSRIDAGDWQILMLNSAVPKKNHGHLADEELSYLSRALERSPKHAIVSLHHNPLPVGSDWLDQMVLDNASAFWAVVDRHPHVRAVVFGHIHQEYVGERNGVQLIATPSTCIQFLPKSPPFRLDRATPGFRRLRLHADGRIETSLERLPVYPGRVEFDSAGY